MELALALTPDEEALRPESRQFRASRRARARHRTTIF
jgi:hypothetical protein